MPRILTILELVDLCWVPSSTLLLKHTLEEDGIDVNEPRLYDELGGTREERTTRTRQVPPPQAFKVHFESNLFVENGVNMSHGQTTFSAEQLSKE